MKKYLFLLTTIGVISLAFTACKKNDPKQEPTAPVTPADTTQPAPVDTIPASFPKKHLIEEFTGQTCGYCPYGMDCISAYTKNENNWVLILHHYGYDADHFTIAGCKTITSALGVRGAPNMCINRATTNYGEGNAVIFHPGYLEETKKAQFATETYASVVIDNTYNPDTRELNVTVSGAICKEDYPALQLTVLVKESGMIDTQADYYGTYEGWEQFRHANAVRAYLTAAKGTAITVDSTRHYTATYSTTLNAKWVPENCMVVAFLSESFKPVIQAEQQPVVAGTAGGADIEHGGVKAVEVPDYYPEPDATKGHADYSGNRTETLSASYAYYQDYPQANIRLWQIQTYTYSAYTTIQGTKCSPFANIYLFTNLDTDTIPAGDYPINLSEQAGTVYAGFRDDAQILIDGSQFYFISWSYMQQGYVVPVCEWLITDGTLTIGEDRKWTLTGHARNGSIISIEGTSAIVNKGKKDAPRRKMQRKNDNLLHMSKNLRNFAASFCVNADLD